MALRIRLNRGGKIHDPHYRIVVIESTRPRNGKFVEVIGHYHPRIHNENRVSIDQDLWSKWIKNGAKPTLIVAKLAKTLNCEKAEIYIVNKKSSSIGISKKDLKKNKSS